MKIRVEVPHDPVAIVTTARVGDFFLTRNKAVGVQSIQQLCQVRRGEFALIGLGSGNRWNDRLYYSVDELLNHVQVNLAMTPIEVEIVQ